MRVLNFEEKNRTKIEEVVESNLVRIDVVFNTNALDMPIGRLINHIQKKVEEMMQPEIVKKIGEQGLYFVIRLDGKYDNKDIEEIEDLFNIILAPYLVDKNKKRSGSIAPLPNDEIIKRARFKLGFLSTLTHYEPLAPCYNLHIIDNITNKLIMKTIK